MLNIVMFCGGTGGTPIQEGLYTVYEHNTFNLNIIINAYDNGKSTGSCRKVFGNSILGPSDLRKNHLELYRNTYKNCLKDKNTYEYKMYELFKLRLSAKDYKDYYALATDIIKNSDFLDKKDQSLFIKWIEYFFFKDIANKDWRKTVKNIAYEDFSLANIFYASCAALNNNSLSSAGKILANILKIPNNVHLISDVNLFLNAETESGHIIRDEGEIVNWNNPFDKIIKVSLLDKDGNPYIPVIGEAETERIDKVILNADIIILSCGTQWSSLIPTYMHCKFKETLKASKAKKYLVMNNKEDADMKGVNANQILDIIGKYIDMSDVTVVLNDCADTALRCVEKEYRVIHGRLSEEESKRHIPREIIKIIMTDYYGLSDRKYILISDLDGTLWDDSSDRDGVDTKEDNMSLFDGIILSGNSYEHVSSIIDACWRNHNNVNVYCDYGNSYFKANEATKGIERLSEDFLIENKLINVLKTNPEFANKITLRNGVVVTIKPLIERREKMLIVNRCLKELKDEYKAQLAGKTTIDIMRKEYSKAKSLEIICKRQHLNFDDIIYIGNELESGNDESIKDLGIKTISVKDITEMNFFLRTFQLF